MKKKQDPLSTYAVPIQDVADMAHALFALAKGRRRDAELVGALVIALVDALNAGRANETELRRMIGEVASWK